MKKNSQSSEKTILKKYPALISQKAVEKRIKEISQKLNKDFTKKSPIFLCILKGSFIFFSEILKRITINCETDFMSISSYNGTQSKEIKYIEKDFSHLENREVIIIDDILDTGKTLHFIINYLRQFKPSKVHLVTLLKRKRMNKYKVKPLYYGFEIKDEFVIGYGLDYNEKYRNLPYIAEYKN